ncbi:hypothetical protein O6P43_012506 [Quillaja saponaria]|uniref:Uncharacterized protein n=1 Tax=Quillaja saponaria TaxID=32244 RepID=A0AAD7PVI5_QUISA|nr:hypothetical protein O6P43_012506 [Quillaja saponaria]
MDFVRSTLSSDKLGSVRHPTDNVYHVSGSSLANFNSLAHDDDGRSMGLMALAFSNMGEPFLCRNQFLGVCISLFINHCSCHHGLLGLISEGGFTLKTVA